MVSHPIPPRDTSRYAMTYSPATDPGRLIQIFDDSNKLALSSINPDTARARFELAVEVYHQLMSMSLSNDLRISVHNAMSSLARHFPGRVVLNEAFGLRQKAAKLKTPGKRLELLQQAKLILEGVLGADPIDSDSIRSSAQEIREEIALLEAQTRSGR